MNEDFLCPKCGTTTDVIFIGKDRICKKCNFAWNKRNDQGWICPTHKTQLKAFLVYNGKDCGFKQDKDYEIKLWCPFCKSNYVIPDDLSLKIEEAFILEEDL